MEENRGNKEEIKGGDGAEEEKWNENANQIGSYAIELVGIGGELVESELYEEVERWRTLEDLRGDLFI